ncbi:HAD family hydrolase [Micromonospora inyonensis]|uniref:Haloacid dehalogenase superfamily, subfamily IA, variant 3 with third motif having DD or ED/haloacid dehalogenase superfamily, subfamily IA, variant 1 with third motif having Dx(3-4)D or Dx(3-4)E n=1 Tax=Micromonospora inyonensis TaxID=47866 RepID=A0A1C6RAL2_9ACTN|nr:HAD family phosphatase [Micromonospora inyonensis]SCL14040.1 haloacid dehalogenase superfamily, subfamily IA, variant 3 with third motif having DD or ED/haloacid dehalogenase superfamily, subfamily IA, variant 1 with third motif having Dx(3-4)D or Dx(3-4)E [Micromonospora inyonensis]
MNAELDRLLAGVGAILLDFDGPVCSIFANHPAPKVAAELANVLRRHGVDVPPDLASEPDPLEVLRRTGATGNQDATRAVEDALCAAERRAVETAEPTPYGREVIVSAQQAGMPVAVVSNNSAGAITAYLAAHRLAGHVSPVVGRAYADPTHMKPNPAPILQAVGAVGEPPSRCVLVGDSLSDIDGAHAAGVRVIGYANRPRKVEAFRAAGADVVITSMGDLAYVLLGAEVDEMR